MSNIYERISKNSKYNEAMQKTAYSIANIFFFIAIAILLAPIVLIIRIYFLIKNIMQYQNFKKNNICNEIKNKEIS